VINRSDVSIRGYRLPDRTAIRRITFDTAFLGEPASMFFDDEEIFCDCLSLYFTDYEPESCFVAVMNEEVIGYIYGTKNIQRMNRIFNTKVAPRLGKRAIERGTLHSSKIQEFLMHCSVSFMRGELYSPNYAREYPATFHINIDRDFRGLKIGSDLLDRLLRYLEEENVSGIQCSTMSEKAKNFFVKKGFQVLFKGERTFWKSYAGNSLPYYVLGKSLSRLQV
jgi:GNAT superfamily N-acetyltransferase